MYCRFPDTRVRFEFNRNEKDCHTILMNASKQDFESSPKLSAFESTVGSDR